MPLVFVHGVNVRKDGNYSRAEQARDSLFQRLALARVVEDPTRIRIFNPYWGDLAARLAWNNASLPVRGVERFGSAEGVALTLLSEGLYDPPQEKVDAVLTVARQSFSDAIDALVATAATDASDDDESDRVTALGARLVDYADQNPQPAWLLEVSTDAQFLDRLQAEVDSWRSSPGSSAASGRTEAFGGGRVWNAIRSAGRKVADAIMSLGSDLLVPLARKPLHEQLSRFFGDVFVYLDERGDRAEPGQIVQRITAALDEAVPLRSEGDPLIVVAHSMGGIIVYDILTHFRPDLEVDVLLTVGSQVSLFEELKLFRGSDNSVPNAGTPRVPRPQNVETWLNAYDAHDVLGFAAERVFDGALDLEFSTGKGVLSAHGSYFQRPTFHDRLGKRLFEVLR